MEDPAPHSFAPLALRIQQYRMRAAGLLSLADKAGDGPARLLLAEAAGDYERLAARLDLARDGETGTSEIPTLPGRALKSAGL